MMAYTKGAPLHETLTMCLVVLQTHADEGGFGDELADAVLSRKMDGLSFAAARIFRAELVSLGFLATDGGTYTVDMMTSVVTAEQIADQRRAGARKRKQPVMRRPTSSPQPVTVADLDGAFNALLALAGSDRISPRSAPKGGRKSAASTIEYTLSVSNRRATTLLGHLIKDGRVERVPRSRSVRILQEIAMPSGVALEKPAPSAPSLTSVTYEELKAAILKLHGENQRLKQRVKDLEDEVIRLNGRVGKLEEAEIDPELRAVLREVQAGSLVA